MKKILQILIQDFPDQFQYILQQTLKSLWAQNETAKNLFYNLNHIAAQFINKISEMHIQDSLDRQQQSYNLSGQYQNPNQKLAMQNLYKQQLDQIMNQKTRQRQLERSKDLAEKREFNQRANSNKQSEKIKEQAYKNYYNMLLSNQEQLQSSYISPYSIRDNMKDQHITHSIEEGEQKMRQWELEDRRRQIDKKNSYKAELMHQIEERRKLESRHREQQQMKKDQFKRYGKLPDQINKYERQRHIEQMAKYKEDLDKVKQEKDHFKNRSMSQQQNVKLGGDYHHALINPLPYNIQNPYILREMNRQAQIGGQNQGNYGRQNFGNH